MMNFENELNPEATYDMSTGATDTVAAAIAAYEAMNDVDQAMLKVDMLEKAGTILADSMDTQAALVAKGYESVEGVPGASDVGYAAVCTMLNIDGGAITGYEEEDNSKKEGMIKKIWKAIQTAAKKVWDFILKMYKRVVDFIKGLFGKGETTDKVIEGIIANGEIPVATKLTPEEGETVATDLSVFVMLDNGIDADAIVDFVDGQADMFKQVLDSKLISKASDIEKSLDKLASVKFLTGDDGKVKNAENLRKMRTTVYDINAKITEITNVGSTVAKLLKVLTYDGNQLQIKKIEKAIDDEIESKNVEKDGDIETTLVGLTSKKVKVIITAKWKIDDDEGVIVKELTLTASEEDIKKFARNNDIQTMSKDDIKKIGNKFRQTVIDANKVVDSIGEKKLAKTATSIIDKCEKALLNLNSAGITSDSDSKYVEDSIKASRRLMDTTVPYILTAISETATDVAKSRVIKFIRKSYGQKLADDA